MVDADELVKLKPGDEDGKLYNSIVEPLREMQKACGVKYLYTLTTDGTKVYYVTDENQQIQYINLFKSEGMEAIIMPSAIDKPFVNYLEYRGEGKFSMERIDSDLSDALKGSTETNETLNGEFKALFSGVLAKDKLNVKVEKLKSETISPLENL